MTEEDYDTLIEDTKQLRVKVCRMSGKGDDCGSCIPDCPIRRVCEMLCNAWAKLMLLKRDEIGHA